MCELLGMSANVPTDIRFSFAALAKRGGETGPHSDGWGIVFFENKVVRAFHDPSPSCQSKIASLVREYPIKSKSVIAHVRKANRGRVSLENNHPFTRELWGRAWVFAHNGQLKGIKKWPLSFYRPIGTTDSEYAFCYIIDQLRQKFPKEPNSKKLEKAIEDIFKNLREIGVFNALLSQGQFIYASCSKKLCYITRCAPFGKASLVDDDLQVDFAQETTPNDCVTIIATKPLTKNEEWHICDNNSFLVFKDGLLISQNCS
ncbi:MAG: class II glutamine amidotransferase [Caulobacterales bacterium]|nr:class II glutamine amidotransferase [Caulobacterales bacterium]MCA0372585.1 class II glutamine amidotransferase [Pseudomonadota bacterium]